MSSSVGMRQAASEELAEQGRAEPGAGPVATPSPGRRLSRADVLRLQQTAGNAAVATLMRQRSAPASEATEAEALEAVEQPLPEPEAEAEPAEEELGELPSPVALEGDGGPAEAEQETAADDDDPAGALFPGSPPQADADDMGPGGEAVDADVEEERPARASRAVTRAVMDPHAREEAGRPAGPPGVGTRVGVVAQQGPAYAQLHKARRSRSEVIARLPFNEHVFVVREEPGGWYFVTLHDGRYGYVNKHYVKTNLPEPSARLYRIPPGRTGLQVADDLYGKHVRPGRDLRFFVNVLEYVNRGPGLRGIYQPNPADTSTGAWKNVKTTAGYYIWVPGIGFASELAGKVRSGSITGGLFATARDALETVQNFAIGGAAFVAGLLDGAVSAVWDLLVGLKDVLKSVWGVLKSLIEGNILRDAKRLWDVVSTLNAKEIASGLVKDFVKQWTQKDIWARWKFRGKMAGYAIAEIAMVVLTGGGTLAVKLAGKLGKLGSKLMGAVKGFTDKVQAKAKRVGEATADPLRNRLLAQQKRLLPLRTPSPDDYAKLRAITDGRDIKAIERLTGLPEREIRDAKHHLMSRVHILVDDDGIPYRGRFDTDPEIARVWARATDGKPLNDADSRFLRRLVRHEFEEGKMMSGESRRSLEEAFFRGELEGMLRKFLIEKTDLKPERVAITMDVERKPVMPFRYAHYVTHYTRAPNP